MSYICARHGFFRTRDYCPRCRDDAQAFIVSVPPDTRDLLARIQTLEAQVAALQEDVKRARSAAVAAYPPSPRSI
jgi:hypothetical protein